MSRHRASEVSDWTKLDDEPTACPMKAARVGRDHDEILSGPRMRALVLASGRAE